ncbi:hydrolase [Roseateles sp. NT4]|uniref:hydrolase n=1 Tax=Roseateles sp. NT4 TaxID=3453715 RepID=UPI003EEBFECD
MSVAINRFLSATICVIAAISSSGQSVAADAASAPPAAVRRQPQAPVLDQLTPENSVLLLIDFQPQYAFSTRSIDIDSMLNATAGLAEAAQLFKIPTIVTTITADAFAGPLLDAVRETTPGIAPIDRTVINAWNDPRVAKAVRATGRSKIVMAGLWTDNCVMLPALRALSEGYEVYVVTDASGDYDAASHERAIQRLVQAGAVPITWLPVALEWQADWARSETAAGLNAILRRHAAALAAGGQYRQSLVNRR